MVWTERNQQLYNQIDRSRSKQSRNSAGADRGESLRERMNDPTVSSVKKTRHLIDLMSNKEDPIEAVANDHLEQVKTSEGLLPEDDPTNPLFKDPLHRKAAPTQPEDDLCVYCGNGDSKEGNKLMQYFTNKGYNCCLKCYHVECCGLSKLPEGDWICQTCANLQWRKFGLSMTGVEKVGLEIVDDEDLDDTASSDEVDLSDDDEHAEEAAEKPKTKKLSVKKDRERRTGIKARPKKQLKSRPKVQTVQNENNDSEATDLSDGEDNSSEFEASDGDECESDLDTKPKAKDDAPPKRKAPAPVVPPDAGNDSDATCLDSDLASKKAPTQARASRKRAVSEVNDPLWDDSEEESVANTPSKSKKAPANKKAKQNGTTGRGNHKRAHGTRPKSIRQQMCREVREKLGSCRHNFEMTQTMSTPFARSDDYDPDEECDDDTLAAINEEKSFPWNIHAMMCYTEQASNEDSSNTRGHFLPRPALRIFAGSKQAGAKLEEVLKSGGFTAQIHHDFTTYVDSFRSKSGKEKAARRKQQE